MRAATCACLVLFSLLSLAPAPARSIHMGARYHGAGGPYLAGSSAWLDPAGGPMLLLSTGGSGYAYHLNGRLRFGGGGQGASLSSKSGGRRASLGRGYLTLAYDFLADGEWEFPLGVNVGGGRYGLERVVEPGPPQRLEREDHAFFAVRPYVGVERRMTRVVKLALEAGWLLAPLDGRLAHEFGATLQVVFLLPKPGDDL